MVWKIINKLTPNVLEIQFTTSKRRGIRAKVPPLNMKATQRARSLYESSFAVMGPKLWNSIPSHLTTIAKKDAFKVALSKYLMRIPDEPPIDGFTRRNSLLDYNILQLLGGCHHHAGADAAINAGSLSAGGDDDLHR